jgi:NAD(P)-dependent dehydrogenase (short-subunit alcohol dehydrogenase family)
MRNVIVVIGAGQIGQAIARRVGVGKHVLLADMRPNNANAAAEVLGNAGYEVSVATVDVSSREAVHTLVETATGLMDSLHAYQLSKRGNSLRVMAEAVRWGKRGARVNTISPGIIMTPLAKDELSGPRGEGYRRMIEGSVAGRAGTPDEVGTVGALLMGPDGGFITGSDILMDGGVTAAYWYGNLAEVRAQQ